MDDLVIDAGLIVPAAELEETFATSGGPGGQHANRASTRVMLVWRFADTDLDAALKSRLLAAFPDGRVAASADDSRSQWRNRGLARRRLAESIRGALRPPPPPRRATRPTLASRRRKEAAKRRRSETKRLRRRPEDDF